MELSIMIGGPLADAINNLAAALQTVGAIEKAQAVIAKTDKIATAEKPAKAEKTTKAETPAEDIAPIDSADTGTVGTIPSISDLRAAADAVVDKKGVKLVKNYLTELGIAKLADLPEDKRGEALTTLRGML